jgi:hypothetical protein
VCVAQIWKTLETTDNALLETITREDYDVTTYFQEEQQVPKSPMDKQRTDRLETEKFYLAVCRSLHTQSKVLALFCLEFHNSRALALRLKARYSRLLIASG